MDVLDVKEAILQARDDQAPPGGHYTIHGQPPMLEAARAQPAALQTHCESLAADLDDVDSILKAALDGDFSAAEMRGSFNGESEDLSVKQKVVSTITETVSMIKDIAIKSNPEALPRTNREDTVDGLGCWVKMSHDFQEIIRGLTASRQGYDSLLMQAAVSSIKRGHFDPKTWTKRMQKDEKCKHLAGQPFDPSVLLLAQGLEGFVENITRCDDSSKRKISKL
ncbi:hypothetical protein FRB96_004169 [Tulasnella sp. 330]|nr:hypothetical protein FRB96_004169 [Tulasnella sp. 330]